MVATPIGNLNDITLRAVETLKSVDIIAAEDTRQTVKLLNHLQIKKHMVSYYKETEKVKAEVLLQELMQGKNIAIVSDAGTPGISDPGEEIVKRAIECGIDIIPIPGACAFVNALIASGISSKEFAFIGFLPVKAKERREKLESMLYDAKTQILYEAPHRLRRTLEDIGDVLGDRSIVLAKEITKIHEQFIRGNVLKILKELGETKGEYVIIVEGSDEKQEKNLLTQLSLKEHFEYYEKQGYEKKEIIKKIAKDRGKTKNEIYQKFIK